MWSNVSLVRKLILSADYRDLHIYNGIKPCLSAPGIYIQPKAYDRVWEGVPWTNLDFFQDLFKG